MDGNVWFERGRVGLSAAACEREFFCDALRDVYFQMALQLGLPQWDLTEGGAVRAGRDCMMARRCRLRRKVWICCCCLMLWTTGSLAGR